MVLTDIMSLEGASNKISEISLEVNHEPVILGVYGIPNHGKTYFMRKLQDKLCNPKTPYAVMWANGPENLPYFNDALYYLIAVPLRNPEDGFSIEGANLNFKRFKNRFFDLNILIFNPLFYQIDMQRCRKRYDLVIKNPNSKHK